MPDTFCSPRAAFDTPAILVSIQITDTIYIYVCSPEYIVSSYAVILGVFLGASLVYMARKS